MYLTQGQGRLKVLVFISCHGKSLQLPLLASDIYLCLTFLCSFTLTFYVKYFITYMRSISLSSFQQHQTFLPFLSLCSSCSALQNGRSQFVINGNWKISVPGEYSVAGTKLLYKRSADTWESFEVPGPTQEDLHLMVQLTKYTASSNVTSQWYVLLGLSNDSTVKTHCKVSSSTSTLKCVNLEALTYWKTHQTLILPK